jgi:hypothetical protein
MNEKDNDHIFVFFTAVAGLAFALPFGTFTVLKTTPYRRTKFKAAMVFLAVGTLVMLLEHPIINLCHFAVHSTEKRAALLISILSLNFLFECALLLTEKWWKEIDYIKNEMTGEVDL